MSLSYRGVGCGGRAEGHSWVVAGIEEEQRYKGSFANGVVFSEFKYK